MRIQTNTAANSALGYMRVNSQATERSIQRLSSGFRINRAADDAAGLAIANKLRADLRGLGQAQRNVAQGSAMLQVMDGAAQSVSGIVDRMKELATQANSANIGAQAGRLQEEFSELRLEIDRIVNTTNYQGTQLINGTFGSGRTNVTPTTAAALGTSTLPTGVTSSVVPTTGQDSLNALTGNVTVTWTSPTSVTMAGGGGSSQTLTVGSGVFGTTAGTGGTLDFTNYGIRLTVAANTDAPTGTTTVNVTPAVMPAETGRFMVSSSGSYAQDTDAATAGVQAEAGNDLVQVKSVDLRTSRLGFTSLDISTQQGAADALAALDASSNTISSALGAIGSAQSRMDFASTNVATMIQNTQAAESTIRDADMAEEMSKFTKNNILQQAAQSMLSQANQGTQGILQLLRG